MDNTFDGLIDRACKEPTLVEALSFICLWVWESERSIQQARENPQWDTLFNFWISNVIKKYPQEPIPMILHCPKCHMQHIDEVSETWNNPPHRSHECQGCKTIWRPADVPTNGVLTITTKGKADSIY